MFKYVVSLVLLMGSVSAFGADALKDSVSDLAASFADLARLLPKKAGGGDEKPVKRNYADVVKQAIEYLVVERRGERFVSEGAALLELDKLGINPRDPAVADQKTKVAKDEQEFNTVLRLITESEDSPARKALIYDTGLPVTLLPVTNLIRAAIKSMPRGAVLFGTIGDLRKAYDPNIEGVLPSDASSLQRITAVNDYYRKYAGMTPEALYPALTGTINNKIIMLRKHLVSADPSGVLYPDEKQQYDFLVTEYSEVEKWSPEDQDKLKEALLSLSEF